MTSLLYAIAIYGPLLPKLHFRRMPWCALFVFETILTTSVVQLLRAPGLLSALQRDERVWQQPWRLFTSMFAQDGGIEVALFNLLGLLIVGVMAEQRWPRWLWLLIAFGGSLVGNLAGVWLQPVGAGNALMVFALAASLVPVRPWALGYAALAIDAWLLARGDVNGVAALFGAVVGWAARSRALAYPVAAQVQSADHSA